MIVGKQKKLVYTGNLLFTKHLATCIKPSTALKKKKKIIILEDGFLPFTDEESEAQRG